MSNQDKTQRADMQPNQDPDKLQQAIQDAHTEDTDASVQIPSRHHNNEPPHKEIGSMQKQ